MGSFVHFFSVSLLFSIKFIKVLQNTRWANENFCKCTTLWLLFWIANSQNKCTSSLTLSVLITRVNDAHVMNLNGKHQIIHLMCNQCLNTNCKAQSSCVVIMYIENGNYILKTKSNILLSIADEQENVQTYLFSISIKYECKCSEKPAEELKCVHLSL